MKKCVFDKSNTYTRRINPFPKEKAKGKGDRLLFLQDRKG
jgi:hypothetical protein